MEGDAPPPGGPTPREEEIADLADPRAPWEELVEDPAAPRAMLAVMFTDIVGSTELATALGDKRWREILEQHDAAIRTQIARFDGREVDTAGDAFFATFGLAVRAVDCALESARAVRRLGLRIRAGVHMGECVVSDGKVRGVSVHIGARVGAKARGDEVLVSSTVRDILAGAGLKFVERGEQTLKGVEGRWKLYAVEPRARDNEADLPPLLEAEIAKPPQPIWKRRRPLVAGLTALAVLIGAIAFVTLGGGGATAVPADSVAILDAASGDVQSTVAVRRRPVGLAAVPDGGVWVANSIDGNVTRIGADGRPRDTIPVGQGPIGVAAGNNLIWVANADGRSVSRVSPETGNEVGERIQTGNGLSAVAFGAGALWVANAVDGTVWRLDPPTGRRVREIAIGPGVRGLAITDDAVWVTSETAGTATQVNPDTGVIVRVVRVGNGPSAVAVGAGSTWVANAYDGTVSRIGASGEVTATIRVGAGPRAIAVSRDRVFVANEHSGSVTLIEAGTGKVLRTIDLDNAPMGLAASRTGDRVWVSVRGGIGRYRGGTLRVAIADVANTFDPTAGGDPVSYFLMPNIYDGLTAFKRVGGPEGNQLVPNLAEEIRPPTDDGLTYSFTLRPGIKFSDGSPLRASDVRATFERVFRNEQYGSFFLSTIKGADACTPEKCDLSSGVEIDDEARTVVFHLSKANAELPYLLAIPSLGIVPASAPAGDGGTTPIPGTGPYRIAGGNLERGEDEFATGGNIILERNPHFVARGFAQPGGYPDRIELTMGADPETNVETVKNDRADFTSDLNFPNLPVHRFLAEFPSRVHVFDVPNTSFVVLNARSRPFDDRRVRQAVNFAIDRAAMAKALGAPVRAEVSCQLLPENMIGYSPHCDYTKSPNATGVWTGPDVDKGRRLVRESGTAGQRVTVWTEDSEGFGAQLRRAAAPIVADALRKIGFRVDIRPVPGGTEAYFDELGNPTTNRQVLLSGWFTDYPGPANYVLPLVTCASTLNQINAPGQASVEATRFCLPEVDRLTLNALDQQEKDPAAAAKTWAAVDRKISEEAPYVNVANFRNVFFVSRRVGNVQGHVAYVVLLSQMWVVDQGSPSPTPD